MKQLAPRLLWILILGLLAAQSARSADDTLSIVDKSSINLFYSSTAYPLQVARFDLDKPVVVKKLRLWFGQGTGSARVRLFGHEGGTSFPQFLDDLVPPQTINKSAFGTELIEVVLPNPITIRNNQFFVTVDQFSGSLQWLTDNSTRSPSCSSNSGGDYYFQFLRNGQGNWFFQNKAFAVEVILEYESVEDPPLFEDVTASVGLDPALTNRTIAWGDYNDDGNLDLLVAGHLYENDGASFTDVTTSTGANNTSYNPRVNTFVDYDNDGDLDILFLSNNSRLMINDGAGNFSPNLLNLPQFVNPTCYSLGDLNGDGYPDLFVGQLWGTYPEPLTNYLYYNDGNNGFIDQTTKLYPSYDGSTNFPSKTVCDANNQNTWLSGGNRNKRSRGSSFVDFDRDGDLDLYVVNYFLEEDELYRNNGDGTFTNIVSNKGIDANNAGHNHGTGVDWADYDNDGDFDLLLGQFAHPGFAIQYDHRPTAIYSNSGSPNFSFSDVTSTSGLAFEETHSGGAWGDINNDGLMDIIVTVYYGCRYVDVYQQQPDHSFQIASHDYGLHEINTGEDVAFADYDNDGDLDVAMGQGGELRLFRNNGSYNADWLTLDLTSTSANSQAIGAVVEVHTNDEKYTQQVTAGRGQRMQKPTRLHFGMGGAAVIDSVVVTWPAGNRESFFGKGKNMLHELVEGEGGPVGLLSAKPMVLKVIPSLVTNDRISVISQGLGSLELLDGRGGTIRIYSKVQPTENISVSELPAGLYYIRISNKQGDFAIKQFVKQ